MIDTFVSQRRARHESERFDPLKLHASLAEACLSVRALEGEAHIAAQEVCEKVIDWLATKTEVTSEDIRRVAAGQLAIYHPDAAYIYERYNVMV